ncbi:MAG: photosystem II protein PsbQ [Prochloraceae cyanobacterium]
MSFKLVNRKNNIMAIIRSILPLILVLVTTLLVSCGSPGTAKVPPTYTSQQIEQIENFLVPVKEAREQIKRLESLIDQEDWIDTDNLIHGPLGSLRRDLRYLSDTLLPQDQKRAKQIAQDLFADIERLDAAAKNRSYKGAVQQYNQALRDFDSLLNLIPSSAE